MNKLFVPFQVKALDEEMEFTAYGNVKNIRDHAYDVVIDGAYEQSIKNHQEKGTTPKLLWSHNPFDLPIGKILTIEEDSKGLFFKGKLSDTEKGRDVYQLMIDKALDSFSIGYTIQDEYWNSEKGYNELRQIDIKEISVVAFACNEASLLQDIKSGLVTGIVPTRRELQKLLRSTGLSKKQAESIAYRYNDKSEEQKNYDIDVSGMKLFK